MIVLKRFTVLFILGAILISWSALAQTTRAGLQSTTNSNIRANGVGAITGSVLNGVLTNIINSIGALVDNNIWTGSNTFSSLTVTGPFTATGLVTNADLVNSSVTIGSTVISLGPTAATSIAGLSSVTSTNFVGALTGHASSDLALAGGTMNGAITGVDGGAWSSTGLNNLTELTTNDVGGLTTPSVQFTGATKKTGTLSAAAGWTFSISSGTYNSGTGAVSLTTSAATNLSPGAVFTISGATGTGSFASINGTWTATAGTSGTTVHFTIGTGLTMTITGGTVTSSIITMGSPNPGWINNATNIFDLTNSQQIGMVSSYSGTTLTLTTSASAASSGSTDSLFFSDASQPEFNFIANVAPGNFGDTNFHLPFVLIGGKADTGANVTGNWQFLTISYNGYGGGDSSDFIVAEQSLMNPTASSFNNNGHIFATNPQLAIPTGMTPAEETISEFDLTNRSPTANRNGVRIFDLGSNSHGTSGDTGFTIAKASGVGFNNIINFGDNTSGNGDPITAGGNGIHFEASSVAYSSLFDAHSLTGNPTNADMWLPAHSGGQFYLCFGTTCGGGSLVGETTTGAPQIAFTNGGLSIISLPSSAGAGGLFVCADSNGALYRKATCP